MRMPTSIRRALLKTVLRTMRRRAPDLVIGEPDEPYLKRWMVLPRNRVFNVYLHEILADDDKRAMHDHPWPHASFILSVGYNEITPAGTCFRPHGSIIFRRAAQLHRLELRAGWPCISMVVRLWDQREWGFACAHGWVHWRDFAKVDGNSSRIGAGCDAPAREPGSGLLRRAA